MPEPPPRKEGQVEPTEYEFEPNAKSVLERLMPMYVEISIYRALLESQASEFGARMTAMDAATRNAKDMIDIPDEVKKTMKFHLVETVDQAAEIAIGTCAKKKK